MSKYTRNRKEIESKWDTQIRFLKSSCKLFDSGDLEEAVRLATTIRVMFHQTGQSNSIYYQLKDSKSLIFESLGLYSPANLLPSWTLLKVNVSVDGVEYQPNFELAPTERHFYFDFEDWWNQVIFDDKQNYFSRKDVVLFAATRDGGAHLDGNIPEKYANLVKFNSLGITDATGKPIKNNPIYAAIRVIAQEIINSISLNSKSRNVRKVVQPSHEMEMRFLDDVVRYPWSTTEVNSSTEITAIVNKHRKERRRLFRYYYTVSESVEYVAK